MIRSLGGVAAAALLTALPAGAPVASAAPTIGYVPGSFAQSTITQGPWTLHQAGVNIAHDASGIVPTTSGPPYTGSGTPYAGYCTKAGKRWINRGQSVMQPYYFPFVLDIGTTPGATLLGFFDYRPRNEEEATVTALSADGGKSWSFDRKVLGLNPFCPWDATDPDNLNINVAGVETAYGSNGANAADNGLGHPFVAAVGSSSLIYNLNRANGFIDSDQFVVHRLHPSRASIASSLPVEGYVSPLASGGYPNLDASALKTTGLVDPDAILGVAPLSGGGSAYLYVSKALGADASFPSSEICPKTPSFALTNLVNGKPRKPNHDVITIRVATTTDGINFTDVGPAGGLEDPTTVALNGTRYLGSGSIIALADGRWGLFFGAGGCLDNDSDGFHYIGYAETTAAVNSAADLQNWTVVYSLDNPVLSTDTVTDTTASPARPYPLNAPVVDVTGADLLSATQVAPFVAVPGGYNSNFFSGRVYDPQAVAIDDHTVNIVFAGYNTPQPSNNLGDYRSIGRFQLSFPAGYLKVREPHT